MGYKKANDVLPEELVAQIQKYVNGESIYIPRKKNERRKRGDQTLICRELKLRNEQIRQDFENGMDVISLSKKYFLSEKSIQRIIYSLKSKEENA